MKRTMMLINIFLSAAVMFSACQKEPDVTPADNKPKDRADKKHKTIDELFEGYEGDYKPEEIDYGEPVGKEIF